jgi:stage II sporulation protein B
MEASNKARITYRFNKEGKREDVQAYSQIEKDNRSAQQIVPLRAEEYEIVGDDETESAAETKPLNQFTTDFGTWHSPFDEETERLERLIRGYSVNEHQSEKYSRDRDTFAAPFLNHQRDRNPRANAAHSDQWTENGNPYERSGKHRTNPEHAYSKTEDDHANSAHFRTNPDHSLISEDREEMSRNHFDRFDHGAENQESRQPGRRGAYVRQDPWYNWPDSGPVNHSGAGGTVRYRHRPVSWMKIFASVTGAVATGAVLGYFILSLFNGGNPLDTENTTTELERLLAGTELEQPAQTSESADEGNAAQPVSEEGLPVAAIEWPGSTYYLLQYGVFSTEEGAQTAEAELERQGMASSSLSDGQYRVFIGVARDKEQADALKQSLQAQNIETFVKPLQLPAVSQIRFDGDAELAETFLVQADQLIKMIGALTMVHLGSDNNSPFESSSMQSLQELYQTLTRSLAAAMEGVPEQARETMQEIERSFAQAVVSLEEYNKKPAKAHLWQAQASIMDGMFAEQRLLQQLSAR